MGYDPHPLSGFAIWIEGRYGICHSAWHWTRIIRHAHDSERDAVAALPTLYEEFLSACAGKSVEEIERDRTQRMLTLHGKEWWAPSADEWREAD